ncbi:hypothetical protein SLEP1_g355 [Rubroshorea leprosula]|uniref:RRM domain-containing protein n=1 Tax=Rubroshorea leprosula TaxID=152421 RepID=A0AAV5HG52_9ROSI|nr:hypothetical protein SLEP1_g355 [Rubroshorea leprosula]
MAISRLLLPKPALRFRNRELIQSRRCCSFSPSPSLFSSSGGEDKSSHLEKLEAAKEERAVAAESKDIQKHSGIVPEAKETRNKVGGSWVKGLLMSLKEKLMWSQSEKHITGETSNLIVDMKVSEANMTQNNLHNTKFHECQKAVQLPEIRMSSVRKTKSVSTCSTSFEGQNSFEGAVQTDASKDIKMHEHPDSFELSELIKMHMHRDNNQLSEPENKIQSSEVLGPSVGCENDTSTVMKSHIIGESNLENVVAIEDPEVVKMHDGLDNSKLVNCQSTLQLSVEVMDAHANKRKVVKTPASDVMDSTELVKPKKKHEQHEEATTGLIVGCGIDQASGTENFSHLKQELMNMTSITLSKDGNQLSLSTNQNHQLDRQTASYIQGLKSNTKVRKKPAQSKNSTDLNIVGILATKLNIQAAELNYKSDKTAVPSEFSVKGKKGVQKLDAEDLINHVKVFSGKQSTPKTLANSSSNVTGQLRDIWSMGRIQAEARVQNSEVKRKWTSSKDHAKGKEYKKFFEETDTGIPLVLHTESMGENENDKSSGMATYDHVQSDSDPDPDPDSDLPLLSCREGLKRDLCSSSTEEGSGQNKVLVRFLKKYVKKKAIIQAFNDCGSIVSVEEVSSSQTSIFKDALVHFKTREGFMNALKKTDVVVDNADVLVQPMCSLEDMTHTTYFPELIGDPEVPVMLVKNPIKTVKVTQLSDDMSLQQLKDALAFCQSSITSIFLGSSSSVAYVEFETEDAKERAIAKHSMYISGKQLLIFRIDSPMTTVVRISNTKSPAQVHSICNPYGKIKLVKCRSSDIVDVQFKFVEWPNMLKIVNSLNGIEVDGNKWLVQPAPVFPPPVLHVLWSQQEGRTYAKSAIHGLFRKIQKPIDTSDYTDLAAYYY